MSDFKFTCPHCNQHLEVPEEALGQTVLCPACQGQITLARPAQPLRVARTVNPPSLPAQTEEQQVVQQLTTHSTRARHGWFGGTTVQQVVQQLTTHSTVAPQTGPKGVGGFLLLFCVWLTIVSPLWTLGYMTNEWKTATSCFDSYPSLLTAYVFEFVGIVALLIYGVIVGCMIWSGNPHGRSLAQRFILVRSFGYIILPIISYMLMADHFGEIMTASTIGGEIGSLLGNLFFFFVWWSYFKKAKRVRSTYGDCAAPSTTPETVFIGVTAWIVLALVIWLMDKTGHSGSAGKIFGFAIVFTIISLVWALFTGVRLPWKKEETESSVLPHPCANRQHEAAPPQPQLKPTPMCSTAQHETAAPQKDEVPWYFGTVMLWSASLFCVPLSFPLVWWHPKMSKNKKISLTLAIIIVYGVLCLFHVFAVFREDTNGTTPQVPSVSEAQHGSPSGATQADSTPAAAPFNWGGDEQTHHGSTVPDPVSPSPETQRKPVVKRVAAGAIDWFGENGATNAQPASPAQPEQEAQVAQPEGTAVDAQNRQQETDQKAIQATIAAIVKAGVPAAAKLLADPRMVEFAKKNPQYAAMLVADPERAKDAAFAIEQFRAAYGIAKPAASMEKQTGENSTYNMLFGTPAK